MIRQGIKNQPSSLFFKTQGYKVTGPRLAVFEALKKAKEPLTIKEILTATSKQEVNQATVYRIVATLEKIGLVQRIEWQHGHAHYELADQEDHHHLVCLQCHRTEDIKHENPEALEKKVLEKSKYFSSIKKHSLEFFGICKSCQRGKK